MVNLEKNVKKGRKFSMLLHQELQMFLNKKEEDMMKGSNNSVLNF